MSWLYEFEAQAYVDHLDMPHFRVIHRTCAETLLDDSNILSLQAAMDLAKNHVCGPVLGEDDLTIGPARAPGQPGHEGPRGVVITHRPTGRIVTSLDGKSQVENTARGLVELKRQLREEGA